MLWTETTTDEEAGSLNEAMWGTVVTEEADGSIVGRTNGPPTEGGQFWADAISKLKDDPTARLAMARRHFPLPAAWREAALALRAMIRKARKDGVPYEAELRELHRIAAVSSFAAYGIIERVPYARIATLDLRYERLGAERLTLLQKTDVKWMRESWGEPEDHTSISELYPGLQQREFDRVMKEDELRKQERMDKLFASLDLSPAPVEPKPPSEPAPRGFLARLFRR